MLDLLPSLPAEFEKLHYSDIMANQQITASAKSKETQAVVNMAKYNKIGKLRRGAFGEISLLKNRETGEVFAGKKLKCDGPSKVSDAMNELFALAKLEHNNIVRIAGVHTTFVHDILNIWLVMEYCPHGTLNDFILQENRLRSNTLKRDIMKQLADAVSFLHEKRIVHRDLKPENILITMKDGQPQAKVADFGLAKVCESLVGRNVMTTFCGTEFFMAPEVFGHSYTEKADVFSLGVIFFALIERTTWQGHLVYYFRSRGRIMSIGRALRENSMIECHLKEWFPISRQLKHAISSMLAYDESDRPSMQSIFRMLRREALVIEKRTASPMLQRKIARLHLPSASESETDSTSFSRKFPHPPPATPRLAAQNAPLKLPKIDRFGIVVDSKYIFKEKLEPWKIKIDRPPSYLLAPRPPPPRPAIKKIENVEVGRPHTASRVPRPPAHPKLKNKTKMTRPHTALANRYPQPPKAPKPDAKTDSPKIHRPFTAAKVPHPPKEPRREDRIMRLIRPRTGSLVRINQYKPAWKP